MMSADVLLWVDFCSLVHSVFALLNSRTTNFWCIL